MSVKPARVWRKLTLEERGNLRNARVTAMGSGLDESILSDELRIFQTGLDDTLKFHAEQKNVKCDGSGNVLIAELEYDNLTEIFSACGSYGVSRVSVARNVVTDTKRYLNGKWVVGQYLADQLMLPMAVGAGGMYLTGRPTKHSETNREVIRRFLDMDIKFFKEKENERNYHYRVEIGK